MPKTLLTTQQAVWLLRISHKTLARMRMKDRGPHLVNIGRSVRFCQNDLLTWITITPMVLSRSYYRE